MCLGAPPLPDAPPLPTRGSHLGSFVDDGFQPVLLLYPEGTTINSRTLDKCRAFAQVRPPTHHI